MATASPTCIWVIQLRNSITALHASLCRDGSAWVGVDGLMYALFAKLGDYSTIRYLTQAIIRECKICQLLGVITTHPGVTKESQWRAAAILRSWKLNADCQWQEYPALEGDLRCSVNDIVPSQPSVIVHVGEPVAVFYVQEPVLVKNSEFFRAALSKKWRQSEARSVPLPDDEALVFAAYLHYINNLRIPCLDIPNESYLQLAKLYVLGGKLVDDTFQDRVIDCILATSRERNGVELVRVFPEKEAINVVYEGTTDGSPARRLMVDMYVGFGLTEWVDEDAHHEFLVEVARAFRAFQDPTAEAQKRVDGSAAAYYRRS